MSSSAKDDYIRQICGQVDNFWVRKRLKKELEAHFDDALESLSVASMDSIEQVKAEMGSPEEIARQANNGHPSIQKVIRQHLNQALIAGLVLILAVLGIQMNRLNEALNKTQSQLDQVNNELVSLQNQINAIPVEDLQAQLDELMNTQTMIVKLSGSLFGSHGFQPVSVVFYPSHVITPGVDITVIEPTDIPIRISLLGTLSTSIVARQDYGILTLSIKNGTQLTEFMRFELLPTSFLKTIRSMAGGQLNLTDNDLPYVEGLYLVRTDAGPTELSTLTDSQRQTIEDFKQAIQTIYGVHS